MSLNAISAAASNALPALNFHPHGHRKGAHPDQSGTASTTAASSTSGSTSATPIGQLPVGATTPLFNNILQSLTQTLGTQVAAVTAAPAGAARTLTGSTTAPTSATSAAGAAGTTAHVQAFMHSLFQALKQDGLGSSPSSGAASAAVSGPGTTAAAGGQYQANLVSSLQMLAHQVGQSGNAAAANLSAAYQNLVNAAGSGTSASSAASPGAASPGAASNQSAAGLQNFLNSLLQNLQTGAVHSLSGIGNNVNANV